MILGVLMFVIYLLLLIFSSSYLVIANDDDNILSKFTQSDYKVKDLMHELEYYNKECINRVEAKIFKPNRTIQVVNFTINFKIAVADKLEMLTQVYKLLSNQYKPFPIRMQFKVCKVINANVLGIKDALKCGNGTECYFEKNTTYHVCNFIPNFSKLPPLMPDGRYMARVKLLFRNQLMTSSKVYVEVYRPIYAPDV